MADHIDLGIWGEAVATGYLLHKGYTVLERNWRFGKKEVDIIARKHNLILFVEVKTRSSDQFGAPENSVNRRKQKFLILAADQYLQLVDFDAEARFDVISIVKEANDFNINHIEAAFIPLLD